MCLACQGPEVDACLRKWPVTIHRLWYITIDTDRQVGLVFLIDTAQTSCDVAYTYNRLILNFGKPGVRCEPLDVF